MSVRGGMRVGLRVRRLLCIARVGSGGGRLTIEEGIVVHMRIGCGMLRLMWRLLRRLLWRLLLRLLLVVLRVHLLIVRRVRVVATIS
jgi:hypothetical protein